MNRGSRRPTKATIVPALLSAVETLCAERSPEQVRMSDIAKEAGVSVGVAYSYFDSKIDLLGATLVMLAERLSKAVRSSEDTNEAIAAAWRALDDNPAFGRIITWAILDGQNVSDLMVRHPVVHDVARISAERGLTNPQMVAAITTLIGIAGGIYGPTINRALQREPNDPELYDTAAAILADWIASQQP